MKRLFMIFSLAFVSLGYADCTQECQDKFDLAYEQLRYAQNFCEHTTNSLHSLKSDYARQTQLVSSVLSQSGVAGDPFYASQLSELQNLINSTGGQFDYLIVDAEKCRVVTTMDELLNHPGWHELSALRIKSKGFGNRWLRCFELDCGNNYFIRISQRECASLCFLSLTMSQEYVATFLQSRRGRCGFCSTDISDCSNRSLFSLKLYKVLNERFPL